MEVNCLAHAFSIALDEPVERIYDYLGHDGQMVVFGNEPSPYNRVGFHAQEMVRFALEVGKPVVPIERTPVSISRGGTLWNLDYVRIMDYLDGYDGVVAGMINGKAHAMAWDHKHRILRDRHYSLCFKDVNLDIEVFFVCNAR